MSRKPTFRHDPHYGFEWGPMRVVRLFGDPKYGYVLVVQTDSAEVELRVSAKGRRIEVIQ